MPRGDQVDCGWDARPYGTISHAATIRQQRGPDSREAPSTPGPRRWRSPRPLDRSPEERHELSGPEEEWFEGFFIVDFLPTSENLSKWVYDCVNAKMSLIDVKTAQVDWFETPKSRSSYRG